MFGHVPIGEAVVLRPSAYALFANTRGHVAVVRTARGYFLPGGGMEPDESPSDTVIREVREECGLVVVARGWSIRAIDYVYSPSERSHYEKRSTFLDADLREGGMAPTQIDHHLCWLDSRAAVLRLFQPSHRWAVVQWQTQREQPLASSR